MAADLSYIDTAPGADSVFAPPESFGGTNADYLAMMRQRWRNPETRQVIAMVGRLLLRRTLEVTFAGPYADEAKRIAKASAQS